jgi:rare lipoprotein A
MNPMASLLLCLKDRRLHLKWLLFIMATAMLSGCGTAPKSPAEIRPPVSPKPGGYYLEDGPGEKLPPNLAAIPDAVPMDEPLHKFANRPYVVFGKTYVPNSANDSFRQSGIASWYGRKFHGQKTSSGEIYDMYAMTAAHPTLPIPSYARVTSAANGKSVVVRVNDRGPFHGDRVIDLSYTAASKLGIAGPGSGRVSVERIFAGTQMAPATPSSAAAQVVAVNSGLSVTALAPQPPILTLRAPISTERAGVFIQLGAFSSPENADSFRNKLKRDLDWMREPINVSFKDGLHRVRIGPLANREEARAIADKVSVTLNFFPIVTQP